MICLDIAAAGPSAEGVAKATQDAVFAAVTAQAREMAGRECQPPRRPARPAQPLGYTQYRKIQFRPQWAVWKHTGLLEIQLFHGGYLFADPVAVHVLEGDVTSDLQYRPEMFDFGTAQIEARASQSPTLAGLSVWHRPDLRQGHREVVSFLGSSYFRAIGYGCVFGASSRGLAVDIGLSKAEEFPLFREFWVRRPSADANSIELYALLDSPSVVGAYKFTITPGRRTEIEVEATIYLRRAVEKLAFAPLTSMYWYSQGDRPAWIAPGSRGAVHDSDGLLIAMGTGEWLWRPVHNPERTQLSRFAVEGLRGFGLMQRQRDANAYGDPRTRMELRPSVWVEPLEGFGKGGVELLELKAPHEGVDNINAYWIPADCPPVRGHGHKLHYRISFSMADPAGHTGARVTGTARRSIGDGGTEYSIRFTPAGGGAPAGEVQASVTAGSKAVEPARVTASDDGVGWVLRFAIPPPAAATTSGAATTTSSAPATRTAAAVEKVVLRAYLRKGKDVISETWSDLWEP